MDGETEGGVTPVARSYLGKQQAALLAASLIASGSLPSAFGVCEVKRWGYKCL